MMYMLSGWLRLLSGSQGSCADSLWKSTRLDTADSHKIEALRRSSKSPSFGHVNEETTNTRRKSKTISFSDFSTEASMDQSLVATS
jgi:hypothetical protein